ncbi:MAG: hypothetical protein LBF40_08395 [Deltaproteobacteria bacterium]|jgi:hypothetical protein|nr:hypothetical protein [Deltaproteobacteria bacterium]
MSEAFGPDPRFSLFIQALREGKTVDNSRKASSLNWNSLYKMKKRNEAFRNAWNQALMEGGRKYPVEVDPRFEAFLRNLEKGMTVAHSMEDAGLYWRRLYLRKHNDPDFTKAWDDAMITGGRHVCDSDDPRFEIFILTLAKTKSMNVALAKSELDCRSLYNYRLKNKNFHDLYIQTLTDNGITFVYDDPRFDVFLDSLRAGKTINASMRESALNWKTLYTYKNSNQKFKEAWDEAVVAGGRVQSKFKAITPESIQVFLERIAEGDTVKQAALTAGLTLASLYKRSTRDPELEAAWEEAYDKGKARNLRLREETGVFLKELEAGRTVSQAARVAGRDVTTFYRLKKRDAEFAEKWVEVASRRKSSYPRRRKSEPKPAVAKDADDSSDHAPALSDHATQDDASGKAIESADAGAKGVPEASVAPKPPVGSKKPRGLFDLLDGDREKIPCHKMPKTN